MLKESALGLCVKEGVFEAESSNQGWDVTLGKELKAAVTRSSARTSIAVLDRGKGSPVVKVCVFALLA